ncbi:MULTISPECIES: RICIN domain-containing protein [Streptomyces]|uniref:Uncharacterized protein n=1 Tax=Streptomyces spororaveus TaxID=284039 RepID=A0ABQ3T630_9ACTN|nr:hypothetical protein [Streptomyces spororaveus]GHI75856.1 hypothetical protein Sspor_14170 [Streptomyces spororaveus]
MTKRRDLPAYRWVCEQVDAMISAIGNDAEAVERHARLGLAVARRYRRTDDGAPVQVWSCHGAANQQWVWNLKL